MGGGGYPIAQKYLRLRSSHPEQRLSDRKGALQFEVGGVWGQSLPQRSVLGPIIGSGGKEQAWRANGESGKVGRIGAKRPRATVKDVRKETSDRRAHARTVLQFVVPRTLEAARKQKTNPCKHIQIEEGVPVGIRRAELVRKGAVGDDLGADGGALVLVTQRGEWPVVFNLGEMGNRGRLKEPGSAVMALIVASKPGEPRRVEPVKVIGEPLGEDSQVSIGESFRLREKWDRLDDFSQMDCFDHTL